MEPVKSSSNGNCLYSAISFFLDIDEDDDFIELFLRLYAVVFAVLNEENMIQKARALFVHICYFIIFKVY